MSKRTILTTLSALVAILSRSFSAEIIESKILPSDGGAVDLFGASVSISGEYAVIGAYGDNSAAGSAYVFKREGMTWVEQTKLTASDQAAGDWFGYSVAIDGDNILVGAPGDNNDVGAAYLFELNGDTWTELVKLYGSDVGPSGDFGWSVSISGDYLIVGAPNDEQTGFEPGQAYIFKYEGGVWEQAKLTAIDGTSEDGYGNAVAISGDYAFVGARARDLSLSDEGSVYVYEREGLTWTEQAILTERQPKNYGFFGEAVAISGDRAVVGTLSSELAYVFVRDSSGWREEDRLKPSGGINIRFGGSVAIDGDFVLVGADQGGHYEGSAYLFRRFGSTWIEEAEIVAGDGDQADNFGAAVALSSGYAVIGSYLDDDNGNGSGSAYAYEGFLPTDRLSARITADPVTIPPEGGTFDYTMHFVNNTAVPQNTDIWIITERPGPPPIISFGPRDKTFGSAASVSKGRSQAVPGNAAAGDYSFILYVGTYPDSIMDSDTLSFTKLAAGSLEPSELENGTHLAVETYPNPFNPSTTIQFSLSQTSQVSLKIFNMLGENVATLISDELSAGAHHVEWNASENASGIYFYVLQTGYSGTIMGKLLLLK